MAAELHAQGLLNANLFYHPWCVLALGHHSGLSVCRSFCVLLQTLFDVFPSLYLGERAIALVDSLTLLPWQLRVNLDVKDTSVLAHLRQRKS